MAADTLMFVNFIYLYATFAELASNDYLEFRAEERNYRKMLDANKGTVNPFHNMLVIMI